MTDHHPITPPPELVASMIMQTFGPLGPTGLADEEELAKAFASFAAMAAEWGYQKHEKALLDAMHATELHPSLVVEETTTMTDLSAAGKVVELVARLEEMSNEAVAANQFSDSEALDRAVDLLERLSPPQPVPVSERLPGPEECLDEGWAWFFNPRTGWRQATQPVHSTYTHWLPAHALPLPSNTGRSN